MEKPVKKRGISEMQTAFRGISRAYTGSHSNKEESGRNFLQKEGSSNLTGLKSIIGGFGETVTLGNSSFSDRRPAAFVKNAYPPSVKARLVHGLIPAQSHN